jgi:hypothetical protein
MNYRVRSIGFAAGWFAAHATEKLIVDSGVRRIILSGKTNGANPPNVRRKQRFIFKRRFAAHQTSVTS